MPDQPILTAVLSYLLLLVVWPLKGAVAFTSRPRLPVATFRGSVSTHLQAASDYEKLNGENRINQKIDLDQAKVTTAEDLTRGDKKIYCRCWSSGTFPLCDGTHAKHNSATGDNVGPLILSVRNSEAKSNPGSSTESLPAEGKKVEGRKQRVLMGYRAIALSYILYCVRYVHAVGIQPISIQVTSGYLLVAGHAYILSSAVTGGRLSSDTYKRLNLSLVEFGIIGVLGWSLVKFGAVVPGTSLILLPPLLATINGVKGYGYGVMGLDKSGSTSLLDDFMQGVRGTLKGYFSVPKNIKGAGYLAATWMVTGLKLAKLMEVGQLVAVGANGHMISTRLSRFARYSMLSKVLYTLKDAADRGRLEGTTFIELNFLSAGVLAAFALYASISSPLGAAAAAFSFFSGFNGVASIWKKRQS